MLDYASILERTREAFASVSRIERALMASPNDAALQINLRSKKRLAERFQDQLFEAARYSQIDVCQYRLIPNTEKRYALLSVSKSMEKFQELFSLVYDALTNGPKSTARVSASAAMQTEFEFGYSYPGSLGVVLSVPGSRDLFTGKFDDSVAAMQQIFNIESQDEVVDMARHLGKGVVNKAYDWSSENFKADFSIDVRWRKSDGIQSGGLIDREKIAHIVNVIGLTSEKEVVRLPLRGVLVGIDMPSKWFHFVVPNGPSFSGHFGDDFSGAEQWAVNRLYRAQILETNVIQYAIETTKKTYHLEKLEPVEE